tara:strand:- start:155 stop:832 length:678 start_codon:yes stop_codon:yes gene_type:complete
MRLGLSMRVVETEGYFEQRDTISHDWFELFQEWGHVPFLLPNKIKNLTSYIVDLSLDGLILTGGNSLMPKFPRHPEWNISDAAMLRDETERQLLYFAVERKMPVCGVCRGLQMINCYFGGELIKLDPNIHAAKTHQVKFKGSAWEKILGNKAAINSYHNYGISTDSLSKNLDPFAFDENGLIEAAAHQSLPILGIMWHPEREQPEPLPNNILFSRLLNEGTFWRL